MFVIIDIFCCHIFPHTVSFFPNGSLFAIEEKNHTALEGHLRAMIVLNKTHSAPF